MTNFTVLSGTVRRINEADLALVLTWRNHASIRAFMYSQHEISAQEHASWFERANGDPSRHLLVYEELGELCGFVSFTATAPGREAVWGFYAAPGAPKGVGRRMGKAALEYAFGPAGFHKISGEALAHNEKSICFHLSLGFQHEGVRRIQFFDSGEYHDVVCFGLLDSTWLHQIKHSTSQRV